MEKWTFHKHLRFSLLLSIISFIADVAYNWGFGSFTFLFMVKLVSFHNSQEAASIGVIGGADGPTVFFKSNVPISLFVFSSISFLIVLLLLYKPIMSWLLERSEGK